MARCQTCKSLNDCATRASFHLNRYPGMPCKIQCFLFAIASDCELRTKNCELYSELRSERYHRIKLGSLAGRINAEKDTYRAGQEQAQENRP